MAAKFNPQGAEKLLELWLETREMTFRDQLVAQHLPLVNRLCRRFQHLGEPMDDLVQVGTIGLFKAIDKYDPQQGNQLAAFAIPVVMGEIKNYFRDHGWAVKLPRKLQRQKLMVDRTVEGLTQKLGRSPTVSEIGDAAGISEEEVFQTFEVERFGRPLSLDVEHIQDDGQEAASILDRLGEEDPDLEFLAQRMDLKVALGDMDSREQKILYMKFYSGLSQSAIAQRLGISQMHVSRLQRSAMAKLKQSLLTPAAD
ncbi:MAG: SigB/SigF/SigG family RNA polymerase sigma factor [Chloroflexi bacterium]|nr:SigB/SigF/SigG family RNA polymerase sigma factor [Chloroflexota bacterium]